MDTTGKATGKMSRKLLLTQKQITAICKGASKVGYVPIIETPGGINIRLVPDADQKPAQPEPNIKVRF
jgi:hypothetical protein